MYGRGMPRNPYGGAPPFSPRDQGFKSPRPLFHSSPMPRFNQQAVPHYTSPPHNHMHPSRSPNSQHFSPSPGRSYNNSFNSSNHSHSYNRSFSSNNRSQFTSPTSFRGNSSFNRNKNGSHYQVILVKRVTVTKATYKTHIRYTQ